MPCALLGAYWFLHDTHAKNNLMQYYNAKDKFIMKIYHSRGGVTEIAPLGGASRRVRRGGAMQHLEYLKTLGGASRRVRRSRSRRGGDIMHYTEFLGGGKRPFINRTCRSKSRCGGAAPDRLQYTRGGIPF